MSVSIFWLIANCCCVLREIRKRFSRQARASDRSRPSVRWPGSPSGRNFSALSCCPFGRKKTIGLRNFVPKTKNRNFAFSEMQTLGKVENENEKNV